MTEMDRLSRLRRLRESVTVRLTPAMPLLSWAFVIGVMYVFIGASVFPGWWKRFLLSGGVLDRRFWSVAITFLAQAFLVGYPTALVTFALAIWLGVWAIFTMGRVGVRRIAVSIRRTPPVVVSIAVVVLVLTLVGLSIYPEEYKTPDEVHAELLEALAKAHKINSQRSYDFFDSPTPPESGFFMYLDGPKLTRTYNALQKDLALALQTSTAEGATELNATVNLKPIGGEAIKRRRVETSIQMIPTNPTPEREAKWLIQAYHELDLSIELPSYETDTESLEAQRTRKTLSERGVLLTREQLETLRNGDAQILASKLSRPNAPLIHAGKLRLNADGKLFRVTFKTGGGANVTITGTGQLTNLDDGMHDCVRQRLGCELNGKLLGVVWRTDRSGQSITMHVVPLALW